MTEPLSLYWDWMTPAEQVRFQIAHTEHAIITEQWKIQAQRLENTLTYRAGEMMQIEAAALERKESKE